MTFLADSALKSSLLLGAALALLPLLRRTSAALRHWIFAAALACVAPMPLLTVIAPSWQLPMAAASMVRTAPPFSGLVTVAVAPQPKLYPTTYARAGEGVPAADIPARRGANVPAIVRAVWATGVILSAATLLVGFGRLRRLARRAERVQNRRWIDLAAAIGYGIGIKRRVRLLVSDHPAMLVTWGLRRPTILLPSLARRWSDERLRVVLLHELAHVRRGDWLMQIVAEIVRGLNWFNPIVWLACRQLRSESERACDDAVLNGGIAPADYASHLVDLARALSAHRRPLLPAPAMARASGLEGRVAAMLNPRVNRRPLTPRARIVVVVVLLSAALSVAGVRAQHFSTLSGTLVDQTNAILPNVTVSLANDAAQTRHEVRTDRTGHFELPGLPDGDYRLTIDQPGFAPVREPIVIAGRDVVRTMQLLVGDLHETILITAGAKTASPDPASRQAALAYAAERSRKVAERCSAGDGLVDGNIGGNIMAPTKIADFKPRYPEGLQVAKVSGLVTLDALIGTDGTIRDVRVVSGDPDLAAAASEAVHQWQFSPTYLNCSPVEFRMGILAKFVAQ